MSNIIKKIYIKLTLLLYVLPSAGMAMSVVTSNYDQRRNKYIVHQGDSTLGSHTQAINDVLKDKTKISKRHAETAEKEQILKAVMAAALIHKPNEYRLSSVLPSAAMDYSDPIAKHFEILRLTDDYAYELIGKKSGVTSLPGYENLYRFSGIDEATFFKWFGEMAESHKVKAKRATTVANASATPFDHKELIKAAKNAGTDLKKWELVAEMLSNNSTPVDKDVEAEIAAIRLLNEYFKEDHGPDLEGWTDALAEAKRIVALAYNKFNARHVAVSPEAKIKEYLDQSEILKSFVSSENYEVNKIMSAALADHVKQNSNKWLSPETLAKAEQFFLNLKTNTPGDKELTSTLFGTKIQGTWNDFVKFCESNFAWVNVENRLYRRKRMQELFPIYQAFSQEGDRKAFVDFCAPYSVGANKEDKLVIMNNFLPIYQAFSEEGDRNAFVNFCASYSDGENKQYKLGNSPGT